MVTVKRPDKKEQISDKELEEILNPPKKKINVKPKQDTPTPTPAVKRIKNKSAVKKLEEDIKKEIIKPPVVNVLNIKTPDIDYVIKEVTRYDLNWYYIKHKFTLFKRWLFSPYTRYVNWWNTKFNIPVIKKPSIIQDYKKRPIEFIFVNNGKIQTIEKPKISLESLNEKIAKDAANKILKEGR